MATRTLYGIFEPGADYSLTAARHDTEAEAEGELDILREKCPDQPMEIRPARTYEVRYIVADHPTQHARYLGFGARGVGVAQTGTHPGAGLRDLDLSIVEAPAEHAEWQAQRLASGGHLRTEPGVWHYESLDEAHACMLAQLPFVRSIARPV